MSSTFTLANFAFDSILDGYTAAEQHAIDHEFLLQGSPLSPAVILPFIFVMVGMLFLGVAWLCTIFGKGTKAGAIALFIASIPLLAGKHAWIILSVPAQFNDFGLMGYVAKYYTNYWLGQSVFLAALALAAVVGIVAAAASKRWR